MTERKSNAGQKKSLDNSIKTVLKGGKYAGVKIRVYPNDRSDPLNSFPPTFTIDKETYSHIGHGQYLHKEQNND